MKKFEAETTEGKSVTLEFRKPGMDTKRKWLALMAATGKSGKALEANKDELEVIDKGIDALLDLDMKRLTLVAELSASEQFKTVDALKTISCEDLEAIFSWVAQSIGIKRTEDTKNFSSA